jgi:RNase P subunit RPR2
MSNFIVDTELKRRRYVSLPKARKQWICDRCAIVVNRGEVYEHSFSDDRTKEYRICIKCSTALGPEVKR